MSRTLLTILLLAALGAAGLTAYLELGGPEPAEGVCPARKAYKVRETDAAPTPVRDDYTPAAAGPAAHGAIVRIAIPGGRSYEELLATLQRAVRDRLLVDSTGSFEVHAFRVGDTLAGPPSAGRAVYTLAQPEGDDQPFPLVLQVRPGYFEDPAGVSGDVPREVVRLLGAEGELVELTETPGIEDPAKGPFRVPAGTKLRILERRVVQGPSGESLFCYRVRRHARSLFSPTRTGWTRDDRLLRRLPVPAQPYPP